MTALITQNRRCSNNSINFLPVFSQIGLIGGIKTQDIEYLHFLTQISLFSAASIRIGELF